MPVLLLRYDRSYDCDTIELEPFAAKNVFFYFVQNVPACLDYDPTLIIMQATGRGLSQDVMIKVGAEFLANLDSLSIGFIEFIFGTQLIRDSSLIRS